ncbi:hypothetical protein EVJ58_g378 [Rhodofomes roseus]|uniref:Elongation factor 1 alpha-like protein n=1 Tax=Rhodofomes roseus TaxID=34475 RepID=A0A4Y9Z5U4_9APHY|nr:hypothetical protein EVJ58_g378 [Rhodofomes roseus]
MSRHRFVRNINIQEELEDYVSDGGEEDMDPAEYGKYPFGTHLRHVDLIAEQLILGLEQVRVAIGSPEQSGLSDQEVKDALYYYQYDVDKSVNYLLEEQERKRAAQERKDPVEKPLPPVPQDDETEALDYQPVYPSFVPPAMSGRSNIPLIRLAQMQAEEQDFDYSEPSPDFVHTNLSTIEEKTERSESDVSLTPRPRVPNLPRVSYATSMTSTTDYGQVIERTLPNPNDVVPSPSTSALQRLSYHEPAPSATPSGSRTPSSKSPERGTPVPVPAMESIPDIPSILTKKSTIKPASEKKSKLSSLASSRSSARSSASSISSGSYTTDAGDESLMTYPGLRPSAASMMSFANDVDDASTITGSSSMSSHVRRAIATALELEAVDQAVDNTTPIAGETAPPPPGHSVEQPSPAPTRIEIPSPPRPQAPKPPRRVSPAVTATRELSLAQPSSPPRDTQSSISTQSVGKQPSKLAMLAQAKAAQQQGPWLPKPKKAAPPPSHTSSVLNKTHTKYLQPVANGGTATTAITTSYQTFSSLMSKDRSMLPPLIPPVAQTPDALSPRISSTKETKPSKLTMKSKAAQRKAGRESEPVPEEPPAAPLSPLFSPQATRSPAKEREKAAKLAQSKKDTSLANPTKKATIAATGRNPPAKQTSGQAEMDISGLNLAPKDEPIVEEEPPKVAIALDKLLEQVKAELQTQEQAERRGLSLVVIGHVDAGKSTLMGRLLYELGRMDEKKRIANERGSSKIGKSSFSWAWELDGTTEERERGITMDIALQSLSTPHREITILDAPGHKDFIPNMISGASQADSALLVVDAATGEFEAGFQRGGQTREHLLLVRSLGVSQVVVAVNKLDQVQWEKTRYEEICDALTPFLIHSGFHPSKTKFVPVGAMAGINLTTRQGPEAATLSKWYSGPTLTDLLDALEPPSRNVTAPLRFPISNVFREQGAGLGVAGRICGGVVQVGERLRILPGDGTAVIKSIMSDDKSLPWAIDGANVILYLTSVDPAHLAIGSVLCRPSDVIPLSISFTARVIIFDIDIPITVGASVELYHHSHDVPASISKLLATLDRATGTVIKNNPRVLTKGASAEVQISLRASGTSGPSAKAQPIPIEPFSVNKDMGRILIRRGGETIGAGIVLELTQ